MGKCVRIKNHRYQHTNYTLTLLKNGGELADVWCAFVMRNCYPLRDMEHFCVDSTTVEHMNDFDVILGMQGRCVCAD